MKQVKSILLRHKIDMHQKTTCIVTAAKRLSMRAGNSSREFLKAAGKLNTQTKY